MPKGLRLPKRPAGQAISSVLVVVLLAGALTVAAGAGFGVTQPLLGDGSAFLAKGHTVAHVNGETGLSDAELAQQLATGTERLQTVRLPDGRVAIVNKDTGTVTFLDAATMTVTGTKPGTKPGKPGGSGKDDIVPVATEKDGYLVDLKDNTVTKIVTPGQPPSQPVSAPGPIVGVAPGGDSAWVVTATGDAVEVVDGRAVRTVRVGAPAAGITQADGHPVVVATDGTAYAVDGAQPRAIGNLGVSGGNLVLGSWRGAGRLVVAVDRRTGRLGALDPRTGQVTTVTIRVGRSARLDAPVLLGTWAYVPDYAGPSLWRVNLATGTADRKPFEVPGRKGVPFSLEVSGGKVWANDQYDRRALVVDADGTQHYVDKGASPDVTDSQDETNGGGPTNPATPPDRPEGGEPQPGPTTPAPGPRVTVPTFPAGTPYQSACEQITALGLLCRPAPGGDRDGLDTGDVIFTDPPGGRQVPVDSRVVVRYVGPLRNPNVVGLPIKRACDTLDDRGLRCRRVTDPTPADTPQQLGVVSSQDPQAGEDIDKGGTVRLTYRDTIAAPSVQGSMHKAACDQLEKTYKMVCTAVEGDPATGGNQPGAVYAQDPAPGTVVRIGDRITVTYYRGSSTIGRYVGRNVDEACADVTRRGFTCVKQEGLTAWGNGTAGAVYQQTPDADTAHNVGSTVTLTFYSNTGPAIDSYAGRDINAACAAIQAAGYVCNPVNDLHRDTTANIVYAQDQAAGSAAPIGSAVTVRYSQWSTVEYYIYQRDDGSDVWVLRPAGQNPPGYGRQAFRVGQGYAAGTAIPGASFVNGYFCTIGGGRCGGLDVNHFASRFNAPYSLNGTAWEGPTGLAVFMASCPAGSVQIYRTWRGAGTAASPRVYSISSDPNANGAADREALGCVWA
ncbi:PASTA domain-containing protein [Luedemannella helvata]